MRISYGSLGVSYLAPSQLPAMLKAEEGNIGLPYADSTNPNNAKATIGIGVNLTVPSNMALVLDQLGVFSTYIGKVNADRVAAGITQLLGTEPN